MRTGTATGWSRSGAPRSTQSGPAPSPGRGAAWWPTPIPTTRWPRPRPSSGRSSRRSTPREQATGRRWLSVDHRVAERADPLDLDRHTVTREHRADTGGGAGEQHITGQQGHDPADVLDDLADGVHELRGVAVLAQLGTAVLVRERGAHVETVGIEIGDDPRAEGAERVVPLAPGPLPVRLLLVARGHIVRAGVAQNHLVGA